VALWGRELLPWCAARVLTDQEVGELRRERPIPTGTLLPPDWPLPAGFPDPGAPVRGLHQGRLAMLLREEAGSLRSELELRGGL
jgi:tRNA pseudouridine55 synthase